MEYDATLKDGSHSSFESSNDAPNKLNMLQVNETSPRKGNHKRSESENQSQVLKYKELERIEVPSGPLEQFISGANTLVKQTRIESGLSNSTDGTHDSSNVKPKKKLSKTASLLKLVRRRWRSSSSPVPMNSDKEDKDLAKEKEDSQTDVSEEKEKERVKWWNRWASCILDIHRVFHLLP
jgi:hypothetical protein